MTLKLFFLGRRIKKYENISAGILHSALRFTLRIFQGHFWHFSKNHELTVALHKRDFVSNVMWRQVYSTCTNIYQLTKHTVNPGLEWSCNGGLIRSISLTPETDSRIMPCRIEIFCKISFWLGACRIERSSGHDSECIILILIQMTLIKKV